MLCEIIINSEQLITAKSPSFHYKDLFLQPIQKNDHAKKRTGNYQKRKPAKNN